MLRDRKNTIMFDFTKLAKASMPEKYELGVYELRSYRLKVHSFSSLSNYLNVKPGMLMEWESEWRKGVEARKQIIQPLGAWFSQIGDLNMVHHLWFYS